MHLRRYDSVEESRQLRCDRPVSRTHVQKHPAYPAATRCTRVTRGRVFGYPGDEPGSRGGRGGGRGGGGGGGGGGLRRRPAVAGCGAAAGVAAG